LGGLARRDSLVKKLRADGNILLLDNGDIISKLSRQDELKYQTAVSAMNEMGYDALNIGEGDLLGMHFLNQIQSDANFSLLCANLSLQKASNPFQTYIIKTYGQGQNQIKVAIIGIISKQFEGELSALDSNLSIEEPEKILHPIIEKLTEQVNLIILLSHSNQTYAETLAKKFPSLDIIICGHRVDEPPETLTKVGDTIILSAANKGMYVGRLDLSFNAGSVADEKYQLIRLSDEFPDSPVISKLLMLYQTMLKSEDVLLLEAEQEKPAGGVFYVGNNSCKSCHEKESAAWEKTKHAKAYSTLIDRKHEFDPECVKCHTVGFGYISGFRHPSSSQELANVGCESCHGAGSNHVDNPQAGYGDTSDAICRNCHDTDNSPKFEYDKYVIPIKH
jgi:hypothetical protein